MLKRKNRKLAKQRRAPVIEALEPRILLSADLPGLDTLATHSDAHDQLDVDRVLADANTAFALAIAEPDLLSDIDPYPDDAAADDALITVEPTEPLRQELVIVDPSVPDYEVLLLEMQPVGGEDAELRIVMLDPQRSGIEQISEILASRSDLDAIHLISHGGDGAIRIGGDTLDLALLQTQPETFGQWGGSLTAEGDILVYGCDVAETADGEALIEALAGLTRADVAASDDLTGHVSQGGDWELEFLVGEVETPIFANDVVQRDWTGTLDAEQVYAQYLSTPLAFEENAGQTDARIDFLARGSGYSVYLSDADAMLVLQDGEGSHVVRLEVVGTSDDPAAMGEDRLESKSNYLIGDESEWLTDVANYGAVNFDQVYDGIDLHYYGNQRQLEYDFIVAAGADPADIRLNFDGVLDVEIAADGSLLLTLNEQGDQISFQAPIAYQNGPDGREGVASQYVIHADGTVGFEVGTYDIGRELVIDPILSWTSYFGGTGTESAKDVAVDASGNVYIAGDSTNVVGLPTTAGPFGPTGAQDGYVAKFSNDGSTLLYATYFGGSAGDTASALAVDAAGDIYVAGTTGSNDFPTVNGADTTLVPAVLTPIWSSSMPRAPVSPMAAYIGGSGGNGESVGGIGLDPTGTGYVVVAEDQRIRTICRPSNAYDSTLGGVYDGFIASYDTTHPVPVRCATRPTSAEATVVGVRATTPSGPRGRWRGQYLS